MKIRKRKNVLILLAFSALLCALIAVEILWKCNTYSLELNVTDKVITLEYDVDDMPEITAICRGTLLHRRGILVETSMKGQVDLTKLGSYKVTIFAQYKNLTLSESRTIKVVDTVPPEIKLVSAPDYYTNPALEYVEEGFTATDNYDGDLTEQVVSQVKDGKVIYTVSDSSGNLGTEERKIIYKDVIAPVITLTQGNSISREKGSDRCGTDDCAFSRRHK